MSTDKIMYGDDLKLYGLRNYPTNPDLMEIVNPETLDWIVFKDSQAIIIRHEGHHILEPGDIFSLPEGYGFEEEIIYCEECCDNGDCKMRGCLNPIYGDRKYLRLVKLSDDKVKETPGFLTIGGYRLKPCPFCGSDPMWANEAVADGHYYIRCTTCQITMKADRRDKVIGFWNDRRGEVPSEESQTHNCAECGKPLIGKSNTTLEPIQLYCHDHWNENWQILFQLIREGKYDLVKEQFHIQRKNT